MIAGFFGGSDSKESACNVGDPDSIPGSGRSLGEGNGYPLQCSSLVNSMDRGAWQPTVLGLTEVTNTFTFIFTLHVHLVGSDSVTPWTAAC